MPFRGRGILASYTVIHLTIYSCEKQARGIPLVVLKNHITSLLLFPMLPCRVTLHRQAERERYVWGNRQIEGGGYFKHYLLLFRQSWFTLILSATETFPALSLFNLCSKARLSAKHPQDNRMFYTVCAELNWKLGGQ